MLLLFPSNMALSSPVSNVNCILLRKITELTNSKCSAHGHRRSNAFIGMEDLDFIQILPLPKFWVIT